jgi:hypothetical protein
VDCIRVVLAVLLPFVLDRTSDERHRKVLSNVWNEARIELQVIRLLSYICVLVLCLSACNKSDNDESVLAFVPSSSYAVLAVNWEIVGIDSDLKRLSKASEGGENS